jgi:hypothetical protein
MVPPVSTFASKIPMAPRPEPHSAAWGLVRLIGGSLGFVAFIAAIIGLSWLL